MNAIRRRRRDAADRPGLDWPTLAGDVGLMLFGPAVLAATGLVVAGVAGEFFALPGFAAVVVLGVGAGEALRRLTGPPRPTGLAQSLVTVALGWLLAALLAAVPFLLAARLAPADTAGAAALADPWSAVFEGMSGITSTGLTMVEAESQLPYALQWWRSVLEWSGAAGVVVFVLAVTSTDESDYRLFRAEGRDRLLREDAPATARRIWKIYAGLTAAAVLAFLAAGAPPWEAVNHGLTGISTGGMTTTDESFAGTSTPVKVVALVVMVLGAVSYGAYGLLLRRELRAFLRLTQVRALALGLVAGGVVLAGTVRSLDPAPPALLDTVFSPGCRR